MEQEYIKGKLIEKQDYSESCLPNAEYDRSRFENCDFSNNDLSGFSFNDCVFVDCNFSLVKLIKTGFVKAKFKGCKLLGLHFDDCSSFVFSVEFEECILNHSSFFQLKLKGTRFLNCRLLEVDFTECDLSGASFEGSDLTGAHFDRTNLEKADLSQALNFSIDPDVNKLKNVKISLTGLPGLLEKYGMNILF